MRWELLNMLKVLIVDDERLSRRRLRRFLSHDPELEIVGECETGQHALGFLEQHQIDLLFLDVQMPGMDGFSFIESVAPERAPCTVFVTAYDQFALRAFDVHALDYLLKPYEERRLQESVRRAKAQIMNRNGVSREPSIAQTSELLPRPVNHRDRIAIRSGENLLLLRTDKIDWIEAADNYVILHCGAESHTLRETMSSLQKTLDPSKFLRVHRSAIVHLDRIKAIQPWFKGDYRILLTTGAQVTLSRSYRQTLHERVLNM